MRLWLWLSPRELCGGEYWCPPEYRPRCLSTNLPPLGLASSHDGDGLMPRIQNQSRKPMYVPSPVAIRCHVGRRGRWAEGCAES